MEFTYRVAGPSDRENYIDFINYVFSHAYAPSDFKCMLPKEYGDGRESQAIHFLALDAQEHIRAVVALLPFSLHIAGHTLNCGFIGSVSVHPYARGEGHMKKLMAMVDSWMRKKDIDLAILGGQRQRYQYFGYTKGGLHMSYSVEIRNLRHALNDVSTDGFTIEEITDANDARLGEIYALYQMSPVRAERAPEQLFDILRSYGHRLYAAMKNGSFAGYFTACKNVIAELTVKNPAHYKPILKCRMQTEADNEITVLVSPWDRALMRTLDTFAEDVRLTSGENYKVYSWYKTLPTFLTLKKLVSGRISDGCSHLCIDGKPIRICCENGEISFCEDNTAATVAASQNIDVNASGTSAAKNISSIYEKYTSLELQEKIFAPSALLRPSYIGGAPSDWFPVPITIPVADQF